MFSATNPRNSATATSAVILALALTCYSIRASQAAAQLPPQQSYAATFNRLAGAAVNLDSLYTDAVARRHMLELRVQKAGNELFGQSLSTVDILRRVRSDAKFVMSDADSILSAYRNGLERARSVLPRLFDTIPDAPLVVQAIPMQQAAASAPAAYHAGSAGNVNAKIATFLVNVYQPGGIARMNVMLGIAHEAYPGHHFQTVYARAHGTSADLTPDNNAYLEGWGIYSERLADEAGLYDGDAISRLGYLTHLLDVFIALQLDIGIHARGWTHSAAVDTMMQVAGRSNVQAEAYANRHAATPGQLATYALGYGAIVRQRELAEAVLGSQFNVKAFHAVILSDGQSTLPSLEVRVTEWLRTQKAHQ